MIATGYQNNFGAVSDLGPRPRAGHHDARRRRAGRPSPGPSSWTTQARWSSARPRRRAAPARRTSSCSTPVTSCAGEAGPGTADVRDRRALPRPLRYRRPAGRREAAHDVLHQEGITALTGAAMDKGHRRSGQAGRRDPAPVPVRHGGAPFAGQKVVRATPGLAGDHGFVLVQDTYQSKAYPEIYAVGIAAQVPVRWHTAVPIGIRQARFPVSSPWPASAPGNIAAAIRGEPPGSDKEFGEVAAVGMMDAGDQRRADPGRRYAPAAAGRRDDPGPRGPCHEARLGDVLPVEEPPRLCPAAVT